MEGLKIKESESQNLDSILRYIERVIEKIQERSGVSIVENLLEKNLNFITLEEEENYLDFDSFKKKFILNEEDFKNLEKRNVGENPIYEIYRTYGYLKNQFGRLEEKLINVGIDLDQLLKQVIERLKEQILTLGKTRKFTNGPIFYLDCITGKDAIFRESCYYAFASTNSSLDLVKIKTKNGTEITLREVYNKIGFKENGNKLFLPNGCGVCAIVVSFDENGEIRIVGQQRNNASIVTDRKGVISSASGSISNPNVSAAIREEITQELGINNIVENNKAIENIVLNLEGKIKLILEKEIGFRSAIRSILKIKFPGETQDILIPVYIGFEERRKNPEVVFLSFSSYDFQSILEMWKGAEDKNESLIILGQKHIDSILRKSDLDGHYLMGYLGYLLLIKKCLKNIKNKFV